MRKLTALIALVFCAVSLPCFAQSPAQAPAQTTPSAIHSSVFDHDLHWRLIGPFRGGRTRAVSGVPSEPNVFYVGAVDGGVWKTNDFGRTWHPIFDHEPTGSIGALVVSPSNPNIIYVGSGEGLQRPDLSIGDGMYKSINGGKTWTRIGLRQSQQISAMAIDPHDPNRVFVAVAGHPYGPNPERGIFRTLDGGKTWQKVLYINPNIGGNDVRIDPQNPNIVYAGLWDSRLGPWENGQFNGTDAGIYKSTDGGTTWKKLSGGLPDDIIQAYIAIAPSRPSRLFASVALPGKVQLYRSDDAGLTWHTVTNDPRPKERIGGGDLPMPAIDPENPNVFYMTSIVTWKSTDGGHTWNALRGAPGGDDYQNIWINPTNPKIICLVGDQGALVTVNGGQTWSSWYNQPTAQIYHVEADNSFPYRLCGGQQESGSVCIQTRGNDGEINFRNWHPVGAEEYGYVAPDPLNPNIVYGGKLTKWFRSTGQVQNVLPKPLRNGGYRAIRTEPVMFSPIDPHLLYFAANTLWVTSDGGNSWKQISPDLSRKTWPIPSVVGVYSNQPAAQPKDRGVIYALAPSPLELDRIWAGTDDGLIWLTTDGGKHWNNVTPPELKPWQKVSILDAGHFHPGTAYAAINTIRLEDLHPYIYRTHDSGKTWTKIVNGLPDDEDVNVVRQDPKVPGLLYCGTERTVYVSFDDGDHWQPLRLNLPATSIRDLIIKNDDLAIATHGRGFWVLDDTTPLLAARRALLKRRLSLLQPAVAYRLRRTLYRGEPFPPETPHAANPPTGAVLDYVIGRPKAGARLTLRIETLRGRVLRTYTNTMRLRPVPKPHFPRLWVERQSRPGTRPGLNTFVWDLRTTPPPALHEGYQGPGLYHDTPITPRGVLVPPGRYRVVVRYAGATSSQILTVRRDPRLTVPRGTLHVEYRFARGLARTLGRTTLLVRALEHRLAAHPAPSLARRLKAEQATLVSLNGELAYLYGLVQAADAAPTQPDRALAHEIRRRLAHVLRPR